MCIVQITDNENKWKKRGRSKKNPQFHFHQTLTFMRDGMLYLTIPHNSILHLQSISQSLVHLGDLGGDAEVDGAVADLDNDATDKVGVDLF
jgi:hypothetical protein